MKTANCRRINGLSVFSLSPAQDGGNITARGKTLRIITDQAAMIHWSCDGWATANDTETRDTGIGCWFAVLPSKKLPAGASIVFTVRWPEGWAGKDFQVAIAKPLPTRKTS